MNQIKGARTHGVEGRSPDRAHARVRLSSPLHSSRPRTLDLAPPAAARPPDLRLLLTLLLPAPPDLPLGLLPVLPDLPLGLLPAPPAAVLRPHPASGSSSLQAGCQHHRTPPPRQSERPIALKRKSNDVGWNYGKLCDVTNKERVKCDFCGHVSTGGINRFKLHITGTTSSVISCLRSSTEAKAICQ